MITSNESLLRLIGSWTTDWKSCLNRQCEPSFKNLFQGRFYQKDFSKMCELCVFVVEVGSWELMIWYTTLDDFAAFHHCKFDALTLRDLCKISRHEMMQQHVFPGPLFVSWGPFENEMFAQSNDVESGDQEKDVPLDHAWGQLVFDVFFVKLSLEHHKLRKNPGPFQLQLCKRWDHATHDVPQRLKTFEQMQ